MAIKSPMIYVANMIAMGMAKLGNLASLDIPFSPFKKYLIIWIRTLMWCTFLIVCR